MGVCTAGHFKRASADRGGYGKNPVAGAPADWGGKTAGLIMRAPANRGGLAAGRVMLSPADHTLSTMALFVSPSLTVEAPAMAALLLLYP